jgi:hypothetical protein
MYLAHSAGGWTLQEALWKLVSRNQLNIHELGSARMGRIEGLMREYSDIPMGLADASVVVLAEQLTRGKCSHSILISMHTGWTAAALSPLCWLQIARDEIIITAYLP